MRLWLLTLVSLSALATQATATVLRSGEHADFSRIVVELPKVGEWQLGRTENTYVFRAETLGPPRRLERVFDLIPRSRVKAVTYEDNALRFILACTPCHADAFEIRAGRVVIDFKNGPAPAQSLFERAPPPPDTAQKTPDRPDAQSGQKAIPAQPKAPIAPKAWLPVAADRGFLPSPGVPSVPPSLDDPVKEGLARSIGQAMTQGLLDPVIAPQTPDHGKDLGQQPQEATKNIAAITKPDEDRRRHDWSDPGPPPPLCEPNAGRYPLPVDPGIADLGAQRAALFNDLGRVEQDAVFRLAASYLGLGFAPEARIVLHLSDAAAPQRAYLTALADALDGRERETHDLRDQIACSGPDLLWAYLAAPLAPTLSVDQADLAVRQYLELSATLRRTLGPRLVARLTQSDRSAQATRVAETTQKLDPDAARDLAQLADLPDLAPPLDAQLLRAAAANADRGQHAGLVRMIAQATEKAQTLPEEDLVYIDSILYQFRNDKSVASLKDALLGYALSQPDSALLRRALGHVLSDEKSLSEAKLAEVFAGLRTPERRFQHLLVTSLLEDWGGRVRRPAPADPREMAIADWLAMTTPKPFSDAPTPASQYAPPTRRVPDSAEMSLDDRLARLDALLREGG